MGYTVFDTWSPYYGTTFPDTVPPGGAGQNSSGQSTASGSSQGSTYFANPGLAGKASSALGGVIDKSAQGYNDFVNNPTGSPAFQNALAGLLAQLGPGEREGQRNLADAYRAAGNTASSSYGESLNKYQQGVDRNRQGMASDLLAKMYPQIAGAMFAPLGQANGLLDALKLQQQSSRNESQSTQSSSPATSGNTIGGGGGGGVNSTSMPKTAFQSNSPFQYLTSSFAG